MEGPSLTGPLPAVGSSSSLSSAGSSSARHLAPGACSEAVPEVPGHCCTFADPVAANLEGAVTFEAPDLPEETLMEVRAGAGGRQGAWRHRCPLAGACMPPGTASPRLRRCGLCREGWAEVSLVWGPPSPCPIHL